MTFWGIKVKPGKPVTHSFDRMRGRLRISQATLGFGSSPQKSLVQCNVGDKSPVLLCALLPDKTESCHLELEFEEADEVVFSVVGPRSVYLTGYYVGNCQHSNLNDDADSYGEDIANTDTEQSTPSDEDEYEDSFIDDDEPGVLPSLPVSIDRVQAVDEGMLGNNKAQDRKCRWKRLRKKYQAVGPDDDTSSSKKNVGNDSMCLTESEDEDNFLLSVFKKNTTAEDMTVKSGEKANKVTVEAGNMKIEDVGTRVNESKEEAEDLVLSSEPGRKEDQPINHLHPSVEVGPDNGIDPNEKMKGPYKEAEILEDDIMNHHNALKEAKAQQDEANNISQDLLISNENGQKLVTDKVSDLPHNPLMPSNGMKLNKRRKKRSKEAKNIGAVSGIHSDACKEDKSQKVELEVDNMDQNGLMRNEHDQEQTTRCTESDFSCKSLLPSGKVGSRNGPKTKKRRKERVIEGKFPGVNSENCSNFLKENQAKQDNVIADSMSKDLPLRTDHDWKTVGDESIDFDSNGFADGYKFKEKKIKKKSKSQANEGGKMIEEILLKEETNRSVMKFEDTNEDAKSFQVRTLSNGLIIEELERGETEGKVAASGRKIKIHYVGMLKENGHVFDSTSDKAPFRFRLGDKEVIEGWNVGLDGMRVGDKRRLTIPPSMGFESKGAGENIPPNSWLVYEVELMGIR